MTDFDDLAKLLGEAARATTTLSKLTPKYTTVTAAGDAELLTALSNAEDALRKAADQCNKVAETIKQR